MNQLIAALLIFVAGTSFADFTKGSQTFAIQGGLGGANSRYDLNGPEEEPISGGGPAWGAQYFYFLKDSPALAIGVDGLVSQNGHLRTAELLTNYDSTTYLKSTTVLAMLKLAYPKGIWRPYIFGGLGGHHSSAYLSAKPYSGTTWSDTGTSESRVLTDDNTTSLALGYGIGMDLFAGENFFVGFEFRGTWLGGLDDDTNPAAQSAGIHVDREPASQGNILGRIGLRF